MTRSLLIFTLYFVFITPSNNNNNVFALSNDVTSSRRSWLLKSVNAAFAAGSSSLLVIASNNDAVAAVDELPPILRGVSLAPLGRPKTMDDKTVNLSLQEIANRLTNDLVYGANGQGGYFLTGDLSLDIFRDDCIFADPTNKVGSLSQYQNALRILFDPSLSQIELLSPLVINEQDRTISGRLRSRGYLQLPWKPFVSAYETNIVYTVDDSGLISRQDQVWDSKTTVKALQESFTPSLVGPPPKSSLRPSPSEPLEVTKLFNYINGRRPNEYTLQEEEEISILINSIVKSSQSSSSNDKSNIFQRELLPGRWILAYLQPGPDGKGIDRRIPFPEFDFNDNFQSFGTGTVKNVGQVLGPWIDVEVSGTLQEEDPTSTQVPKTFRATIQSGKLCTLKTNCINFPIRGEGIFSSLYLGERLRIGQNINGGGARVVQIRLVDGR